MPGVQFGQQIDMNGLKVTELAPGTAGTDAVNVDQLADATGGFVATIGDGIASSFNLVHNFNLTNKNDFVIRVGEIVSGSELNVENAGVDVNTASVTFGFVPTSGQFRVAMLPVRP